MKAGLLFVFSLFFSLSAVVASNQTQKVTVSNVRLLGLLHMSPVDRAGSLTGTNFILGSYDKFQPGFRDEKRPKTSCGAKFEKQSKHSETQNYNFHAYYSFGNSYSCITVVECDAYDVENTADNAEFTQRIHLAFIPVTGLKCSYGNIFSPLTEIPVGKTEISGTEPAHPLI